MPLTVAYTAITAINILPLTVLERQIDWKCLKHRGNTKDEVKSRVRWVQIWVLVQPSTSSVTSQSDVHLPRFSILICKTRVGIHPYRLLWEFHDTLSRRWFRKASGTKQASNQCQPLWRNQTVLVKSCKVKIQGTVIGVLVKRDYTTNPCS